MDAGVRRVIVAWLLKNVDGCDGPCAHGKGPTGNLPGAWRYRVGACPVMHLSPRTARGDAWEQTLVGACGVALRERLHI